MGHLSEVSSASTRGPAAPLSRTWTRPQARTRHAVGHAGYRYPAGIALLASLYYATAKLGFALGFSGPIAAIVWLPVGVAIAFVYLGGLAFLPGALIGDLWVNQYSHFPVGSAFGQTIGNMLEVAIAVVLIRKLVPSGSPLKSASSLVRLLTALAAGTLVSAVVGPLSLRLGGVGGAPWVNIVRTWWLGDFSGALIVVPLVLAWSHRPKRGWRSGFGAESLLALLALAGLTELALSSRSPLSYLVFPGLIWAALRFGSKGATLAIAIVAALTVWNTTHYHGPFAFTSITRTVLDTQLFIAISAISALCVAALVSEREEVVERLGASRNQLLHATDSARETIERNLHDGAQQRLIALAIHLRLAARAPLPERKSRALLEDAEAELLLSIDELRELAHGTHPSVLTNLGLAPAISRIAAGSDIPVTLHELPEGRLDDAVELTGYFVVAESLTNARKHSGARQIHVRARLDRRRLRIEIADDGVGGAELRPAGGLAGLRDRVEETGGTFDVVSRPGAGTRVVAAIPLRLVASGT